MRLGRFGEGGLHGVVVRYVAGAGSHAVAADPAGDVGKRLRPPADQGHRGPRAVQRGGDGGADAGAGARDDGSGAVERRHYEILAESMKCFIVAAV